MLLNSQKKKLKIIDLGASSCFLFGGTTDKDCVQCLVVNNFLSTTELEEMGIKAPTTDLAGLLNAFMDNCQPKTELTTGAFEAQKVVVQTDFSQWAGGIRPFGTHLNWETQNVKNCDGSS